MFYHYRKTHNRYKSFKPSGECDFCNPQKYAVGITRETKHAYIIHNRVFYDLWEMRKVVDHQMIIPKRHVEHLGALDAAERADIMDLIAEYETTGYEIYARSPKSVSRSVSHQHTHLIKTEGKPGRAFFYLSWPYTVLRWR